ncbi:MAG: polynucleotide kinase-phosphatase [Chloroflexi bacterium]|nr:polynucleotide kinase-phosphatase [Chloroflexota bacterium]OJV92564.1 MAG: polynucleotide kinase-phosphatase [Chloroflexi bacterium 54-19]
MKITLPELSLVVLVGASGSGKSSFARQHFLPTEVISSDFCRGLVSDNENDQSATTDAFEVLNFIAAKRLAAGRLTVIDATNVQKEARQPLLALARQYHVLPVAIVLDMPEKLCLERNRVRPDRDMGPHVIRRQVQNLRQSLRNLEREGFRHVFKLNSPEEVAEVTLERQPLWNNRRHEHGPFDLIGDVHGCAGELFQLLEKLGYVVAREETESGPVYRTVHPDGRKAVFLGDLVDRGPRVPEVLRLVMDMQKAGTALVVPGNHDTKLMRKLKGHKVQVTHGLTESLEQLDREPASFKRDVADFIDGLVSHYVLDGGKLVVAHAGLKAELQGRGSAKVREFALYGETTGETDEFGLPVRYNWAAEYRGKALVVYGHTPVPAPEFLNNTICIDTGCVYGGNLTALRYPEKELVAVPAAKVYYPPARPFPLAQPERPSSLSAQQQNDDVLDIEDVSGKRVVQTRLQGRVTLREENTIAALEVMSRFAANPRWLIYLPPTMSPTETSQRPGFLEYPTEAFEFFRRQEVTKVVCEEKHMGSRAVVVVCRDAGVARQRFGVEGENAGIVYTRTGRRFFEDAALEAEVLEIVRTALDRANFWDEFKTNWAIFDCELMPWSAKAQELLRQQYAAVGAAASLALPQAVEALSRAAERGLPEALALLERYRERATTVERFVESYRHYCWPVNSVADLRLAPFHLLATEGQLHLDRNHVWHMATLANIVRAGQTEGLLFATPYLQVELNDPASEAAATAWWEDLTKRGGEGMVIKPLDFVTQHGQRLIQPALKCRGPEYLRLIYGPEYSLPENLERLRARGLSAKRSLALREFALGVEGLERFVAGEPLRRVHECSFGVLALESEPVDPRL